LALLPFNPFILSLSSQIPANKRPSEMPCSVSDRSWKGIWWPGSGSYYLFPCLTCLTCLRQAGARQAQAGTADLDGWIVSIFIV